METVQHGGATLSSTTDSAEAVAAAVGAPPPELPPPAPEPPPPPTPDQAPAVPADDAPPEPEEGVDDAPPEPPKKTSYQSRIDRLTAERRQAEARAAALEIELQRIRAAAAPLAPPEPEVAIAPYGKPRLEQFEVYEDFVEALAEYKAEEKMQSERARVEALRHEQARVEAHRQYLEQVAAVRSELPDYDAVVNQPLPISQVMQELIVGSPVGPRIAYHLGQHPDECVEIAALPPHLAARALGRIEARLEAAVSSGPSSGAPLISRAPAPPKPVGASTSVGTVPSEKLDWAAFVKRREQEEKEWRASRR